MMDINIKIEMDPKKGLMGVSLDELKAAVIVPPKKKKKKKKKEDELLKAVASSIPAKTEYKTEVV